MEFLNTNQAAEYLASRGLHIAPNTLYWYRSKGDRGPRSTMIAKRVVWRVSDLDLWIAVQAANNVRGGVAA
jgi:predicted DNA-binding transcriptional regulator AlpA